MSGGGEVFGSMRGLATALAVCTALALALLAPALLGRAAVAPEDVLDYDPLYRTRAEVPLPGIGDVTMALVDLPRDLAVARQLRRGRLTMWNPLSAAGAPLWAEQGGPFFPLKLPFYAAPSAQGYAWFLCLRLIAAGLGAWALARTRALSAGGALAAGATFELSGATIEAIPFGAASAFCLLPWAVLGAEVLARQPRRRAAVGAAIVLGLAASGGHPTVGALVFAAFATALAGHALRSWRMPRHAGALAAWGLAAVLIGALLAAPTLLPQLELIAHGSSYKQRAFGPVQWQATIDHSRAVLPLALVAPNLLQAVYAPLGPAFEGMASVGIGTLVLGLAGVLGGAPGLPLSCVALLGLAIAAAPPGLGWVSELPGLRLISAYYAWPLVVLAVTQAAGTGIVRAATPAGRRALVVALCGVALGLLLTLFAGMPDLVVGGTPLAARAAAALAAPTGWVRLLAPPVAVAAAVLFLMVSSRRGRGSRRPAALLAAVAVGELLLLWGPTLRRPPSPVPTAAPSAAVELLQDQLADADGRLVALPFWVGFPLTPMRFGLADVRGMSALPIRRYVDYMESIDPLGSLTTVQMTTRARAPLLDLAAVRAVVLAGGEQTDPAPHLEGDVSMPLVHAGPFVSIYENRAALPRVRVVHRVEPVAGAGAARARLRELASGRTHASGALADTVRLEPSAAGEAPPALDGPPQPQAWARIVDASDPDALRIEVDTPAPAVVVVADTYYPGWHATVDDVPAPIFPADLLFRAVPVPAGRHVVALRYAPASFRWGMGLFAVGAVASLALMVGSPRSMPPGAGVRRGK